MPTTLEELKSILDTIISELVTYFPRITLSIITLIIILLLIKLINTLIKWTIKVFNLESLIKDVFPKNLRISLTTLITVLADLGLVLAGIAIIGRLLIINQPELYTSIILYTSRIISIIIIILIFAIGLDAFMKHIQIERKLENVFALITLLLLIIVLIDLTAFSPEIKYAISLGISIGLGLSIGIFTFWLLFRDYIETHKKQ
ncbi:MAG: hypothetical protein QW128_01290 [Thermoprotei archaeon]